MTTSSPPPPPLIFGVITRDLRCDDPKDLVDEADEDDPDGRTTGLSIITGGWLVTTVIWLTLLARLLEGSARTVSLLMVMVEVLLLLLILVAGLFGVDVIRISSSGSSRGGTGW